MIPSFVSSKSKLVEPLMLEKINLLYDRLKATATAKSKIISYGTSCAWTFYLIKKFFVCSCGDSLRIYFLGENQFLKRQNLLYYFFLQIKPDLLTTTAKRNLYKLLKFNLL